MSVTTTLLASGEYGLPDGVSLTQALSVIIPMGIVTVCLRWAPFIFVKSMRDNPLLETLGRMMPVGVMVILVVYAVIGQQDAPGGIPAALVAVLATIALQAWKRSLAVSIFGGMAVYMVLVNLVF